MQLDGTGSQLFDVVNPCTGGILGRFLYHWITKTILQKQSKISQNYNRSVMHDMEIIPFNTRRCNYVSIVFGIQKKKKKNLFVRDSTHPQITNKKFKL